MISPNEYALLVPKKIPEVLISHVVPIPSFFNGARRAGLKRSPPSFLEPAHSEAHHASDPK
jgi:hypothetical protein